MDQEAMPQTDTYLLQDAKDRANIQALLNADPSKTFNIQQVMAAIKLSRHVASRLLNEMADQGQIQRGTEGTSKLFSAGPIVTMGQPAKKTPQKAAKTAAKTSKADRVSEADSIVKMAVRPLLTPPKAKDIELVVGGRQIIIGSNPQTGRLRITIE